MEALRDRTIKVDIPYITRFSQEVRFTKDFVGDKVQNILHPIHLKWQRCGQF